MLKTQKIPGVTRENLVAWVTGHQGIVHPSFNRQATYIIFSVLLEHLLRNMVQTRTIFCSTKW